MSGIRKGKRIVLLRSLVFGILKHRAKLYVKGVADTKTDTRIHMMTRKTVADSVVYIDYYRSDNALDVADVYDEKINHTQQFDIGKIILMLLKISGIKQSQY